MYTLHLLKRNETVLDTVIIFFYMTNNTNINISLNIIMSR